MLDVRNKMRMWERIAIVLLLVPALASAQGYRDLDAALSGVSRGFEQGDAAPILAGVASDEQVKLEFPGLVSQEGIFGRDQASYLLEELFGKTGRGSFEQRSARKISAENQYQITADWTFSRDDKSETRQIYITLGKRGEHWSIVSIRSPNR